MRSNHQIRAADVVGLGQLTIDAITGISELVEQAQKQIAFVPGAFLPGAQTPTDVITALVHNSVRGISRTVGRGLETWLPPLTGGIPEAKTSSVREALVAALNGVVGDYLAASRNPLAICMRLRLNGCALSLERAAIRESVPQATGKLLVLVHGLCHNDLQWKRGGHDYGSALARDLGYTPLYLHYNSGLHISDNGSALSKLLENLVEQWPVPLQELAMIGYSAGGLVCRSACHHGSAHRWRRHLRDLVFLGTPHHGAPFEQWGNLVNIGLELSPFSAPYSRLAKLRSAGITDLRHGNVRHEDWDQHNRFAHSPQRRKPLPLPKRVRCYAVAASVERPVKNVTEDGWDGMVTVSSALGQHHDPAMALAFPPSRQWIAYNLSHSDLLYHPEVLHCIQKWLRK